MTTLRAPSVLYYLRCLVCKITFVSYDRAARCPLCINLAEVYGLKEIHDDA